MVVFVERMDQLVDEMVQKWKIEDSVDVTIVKLDDLDQLAWKRFWLVGRLLTSKSYNVNSLMKAMNRIWRTREAVAVFEWDGCDRLLFSFRTNFDRSMVMRGVPWSFDNALLLLAPIDGKTDPLSVQLVIQNFWIRIRGLPPAFLSKAMGRRLGSLLGEFVDTDPSKGECTRSFLRIRVGLEVSKPLRRWIMLDLGLEDASTSKLQLEYEDLPYFCLFCGRLSHISAGCPLAKQGAITEQQFGRWRTVSKNVFNIEPEGQLSGLSFGLSKKSTPWKL